MTDVSTALNGATHKVDADPSTPFYNVLATISGRGPRFGCGLAQCGACHRDHRRVAMRSCIHAGGQVSGEVTTLEGLAKKRQARSASSRRGSTSRCAVRLIAERSDHDREALLDRNPHPTDAEIREGWVACMCRCHDLLPDSGGHQAVVNKPRRRRGQREAHP